MSELFRDKNGILMEALTHKNDMKTPKKKVIASKIPVTLGEITVQDSQPEPPTKFHQNSARQLTAK